MGALHAGHLSLIEKAKKCAGPDSLVIVSIFVNPTQFDRKDDFENYPNTLVNDLAECEKMGVDVAFTPPAGAMYQPDHSITILEKSLSQTLCGATRPGHFDGVCTVVLKLFMLTNARWAVFGEKDFQQLAIIKRLVRDLNLPVEIIPSATVRENDGLAMSSRNLRLSQPARNAAPAVRRALLETKSSLENGDDVEKSIQLASQNIKNSYAEVKIDYLDLVDAENLQPVFVIRRPALLAIAVFYDDVRLIDNILIEPAK